MNDELAALHDDIDSLEPGKGNGVSFTIRRAWHLRLMWMDRKHPPDLDVLHALIDQRPALVMDVIEARSFAGVLSAARSLHSWLEPRGYRVHIAGANFWTDLRLRLHDLMGGFNA